MRFQNGTRRNGIKHIVRREQDCYNYNLFQIQMLHSFEFGIERIPNCLSHAGILAYALALLADTFSYFEPRRFCIRI